MKKTLALLLVVVMLVSSVGLFASCKKNSNVITVGYTIYEPMNYLDENGNLIGFDTELAQKVFGNLGYEVNFKRIEWKNKYIDLKSGTIDCIWNGFTANTSDDDGVARSQKVDFSYNYMRNKQVVVVKAGSGITTEADLAGKIGVAEAGSAGEEFAKDSFKSSTINSVTAQMDALMEVKAGTADFAVLDDQLANKHCGKGNYTDLTVVEALSGDNEFYAIGFKKKSKLTAKVNEQLEALAADGTLLALAQKYGVDLTVITDFSDQKK